MNRLVDWHVHVLPSELRGMPRVAVLERETSYVRSAYRHPRVEEITERASVEAVRASMAAHGVDVSVCFGQQWRDPDLCAASNAYVVEEVEAAAGALRGLLVAQPAQPHTLDLLERQLDVPGVLGVKVKPKWGGFSLADEAVMAPLCELLQSKDAVLLTHVTQGFHHSAGDNVADLVALLRHFPDLRVVAAHLGGFIDTYRQHAPVGRLLRNVWIDISLPSNLAWLPSLMELGDRDRYLYATDFPYGEPADFASALATEEMERAGVRQALRHNGEQLLRQLEGL